MCRCCQSCWEDCYWNCIEERFCYDETIAHYDPEDDEYARKKSTNGFYATNDSVENNNAPICRQPARIPRNLSMSSKIHEDDLRREIQTNVPMLAPEVLAVFAHSQIFQETPPPKAAALKSTPTVKFVISPDGSSIEGSVSPPAFPADERTDSAGAVAASLDQKREDDSEKLLKRLEGSSVELRDRSFNTTIIPEIVEEDNDDDGGEIVLRPPRNLAEASSSFCGSTGVIGTKGGHTLAIGGGGAGGPSSSHLLQAEQPYFSIRPASENDIFTISSASNYNTISMTPDVPAISYSNLPKNYLETPTIEKYRESVSLFSIQTAGISSIQEDYSMPRYYRKSDLFVNSQPGGGGGVDGDPAAGLGTASSSNSSIAPPPSAPETKSKRLKNIRNALPPLNLQLIRGNSASNLKEREREAKEKLKAKDSIK